MHVQVKEAQKTSSSRTDGRMFATQTCLFHDEHHEGCQPTSLMTVIVEAAQVEKKWREDNKTRGADKAHVCRRASSVCCSQPRLQQRDEIRCSLLRVFGRCDKLSLQMELRAVHGFQMGNLCPPASPNCSRRREAQAAGRS